MKKIKIAFLIVISFISFSQLLSTMTDAELETKKKEAVSSEKFELANKISEEQKIRVKLDDKLKELNKNLKIAVDSENFDKAEKIKNEINNVKNIQKKESASNDNIKLKDRKKRTYIIEYDFQTGLFPDGKGIKPRVDIPVVFKIKNINRLAYTVDIKSKDSVIGFSDLSDLEMFFKKKEETGNKDNLKNLETDIPLQNINLLVNSEDLLKIQSNNKKDTNGFTTMVNEINKTNVELLDQLNTKINSLAKDSNEVDLKLDSIKIPESLEGKFPYHFKTQQDLAELYLNILEKRQILITLWNDYLQVNTLINNPLLNTENVTKITDTLLPNIHKKYNKNKNILNDYNLLVNRFQNLYNSLKVNPEIMQQANYGGSIKLFSIVDNLNIEVKSLQQQIEAIKFATLKQYIDQIYSLLVLNNDTTSLFEYVSNPIQAYQDVVVFKVKINKNNKDTSLFFNERDFSYNAFTRHGIRYDLNIGLASSFFTKDFYEINADSLNVNRIYKTDKFRFSPSFVGFFTTSYRSATHFTVGLSIGLGISADNGSIEFDNFFLGLSGIVGRRERINLTCGVSFKDLPILNNGYKEGQEIPNNSTLDNVTTKSYQPGFFIALTYNLTKGVKDNVKQIKNLL